MFLHSITIYFVRIPRQQFYYANVCEGKVKGSRYARQPLTWPSVIVASSLSRGQGLSGTIINYFHRSTRTKAATVSVAAMEWQGRWRWVHSNGNQRLETGSAEDLRPGRYAHCTYVFIAHDSCSNKAKCQANSDPPHRTACENGFFTVSYTNLLRSHWPLLHFYYPEIYNDV